MKKLPYGISNYEELIRDDYYYVDKTMYIEQLENLPEKRIMFLRPRKFGKTLFTSTLENYYDLKKKDKFEELYGKTYIGKNPTKLKNSYHILKFNFSGIDTSTEEATIKGFREKVKTSIRMFIKKYDIDFYINENDEAENILDNLFKAFYIQKNEEKIYVIIDEYDHFANELLGFNTNQFKSLVSKNGKVRKWYEILKEGTESVIDRIFITGVAPITLDSLTSGFNISSDKTQNERFNEMMGFTKYELKQLMETIKQVCIGEIKPEPRQVKYIPVLEDSIAMLSSRLQHIVPKEKEYLLKWISLKIIDGEPKILSSIQKNLKIKESKELEKKKIQVEEMLKKQDFSKENKRDKIIASIVLTAEKVVNKVVSYEKRAYQERDRKIDKILTSKKFGIPIMIVFLAFILWLTIVGANYPSSLLSSFFEWGGEKLRLAFLWMQAPAWVTGIMLDGIYKTVTWIIAVMLPPMAIFFPLFTLLEDLGVLPRIAFNLDKYFKRACSSGKQALTMCMGLGCNAAGVVGCRIIDSPREKLIGILTNSFMPCNGRFPFLITIATIFIGSFFTGIFSSIASTLTVLVIIILGVVLTLVVSKILSKTILRGFPSSFILELPPYRKPQIGKILIRSIFDRTLFVLRKSY